MRTSGRGARSTPRATARPTRARTCASSWSLFSGGARPPARRRPRPVERCSFEIAETELCRACGLAYARVFDRYDIFLPRKAVHSEFYFPARLDDRLRVATYVGRVGTKSMTLNFGVLRDDPPRLGAAGWMVLVSVDRKALKPRPLPPGLVEALAPHTLTTAAARAILGITTPPGARAFP